MKAIILNILFVIVWGFFGHYLPSVTLFTTFFTYPFFILFSANYMEQNLSKLFFIPLCFLVLLFNDYLFRILGGGIHDDAGRAWCELSFYITFSVSTIALLFLAYKFSEENKLKWFYNSFLVAGSALITYFVFMKFNIKI
jgi:hypothetical protein